MLYMLRSVLLLAAFVGTAGQGTFSSCYKGAACAGQNGCCDCAVSEAQCTGTWYSGCTVDYCKVSNTDGREGCYVGGGRCDCSVTEAQCTGTWLSTGCLGLDSVGQTCTPKPAGDLPPTTPPAPPSPPKPPSTPPSPPQACIAVKGRDMPATTAESPDPINEPCYSHSSCRKYTDTEKSGYVCCVKVGTCDNLKSSTQDYYVGGCRGNNYKYNASYTASTSSNDLAFPSTIEGCVKQGECNIPYLEQMKDWTSKDGPLEQATPPDATITLLLDGAISTPAGACRNLYPFTDVFLPTEQVVSVVTADGDVADYTEAVVFDMEKNIAVALDVPEQNVDITVAAGSVKITIQVAVKDETAATAMTTKMNTAMATPEAAGTLLSTPALTVTATEVAPAAAAVMNAPPNAPPPASSLSTGAVAGIAVGASLFVIVIIVLAIVMMKKKKANTKEVPSGVSA